MAEYAFDVILRAALRVPDMPDEATARAELAAMLDAAYSNFGLWSNGEPILGEASIADDVAKPRLFEVDGADVAPGSYFEPIGETQLAALKMAAKRALCVLEGVATIRQPGDAIAELARALALFSEPESAPANPRHAEITLSLRAAEASKARHDGPTVGPTVLAAFNRMATPTSQYRPGSELDRLATGNHGAGNSAVPQVTVTLEGGVIQSVDFEGGPCTVTTMDFDVDGMTDAELKAEAEENDAGDWFIKAVYSHDGDSLAIPSAADLARSRLNDAAGDMLAALEEALEVMGDWGNDGEPAWAGRARAAITRAKGE